MIEKTLLDEFIAYSKEKMGFEISLEDAEIPDTFETFFGSSFFSDEHREIENCVEFDDVQITYSAVVNEKIVIRDKDKNSRLFINDALFLCSGDNFLFAA